MKLKDFVFLDFFYLTKWLLKTMVGNSVNFMGVNVITFRCIL